MTYEIRRWEEKRTVQFALSDIEPKDQAHYEGDKRAEKLWQPTNGSIVWVRGTDSPEWYLYRVLASGPRLKKDGEPSAQDHYSRNWNGWFDKAPEYPDWMNDCVEAAHPARPV